MAAKTRIRRRTSAQAPHASFRGGFLSPAGAASLIVSLLLFAAIAAAITPRDLDVAVYREAAHRTFIEQADPYVRRAGDGLPFTYPPTALFLVYPLSRLDAAQSIGLMTAMNWVLAPVLMVLLVSELARDGPGQRLYIAGPLYVASFGGIYLTLVYCQINLLILLCLWVYWRGLRRGRAGPGSGAALALGSVAKPHYVLLLAAAGGSVGARLLAGFTLAGAALVLLSLLLAPSGSWESWRSAVLGTTSLTALPPGHSSIAAPWNRSIPGEVARFFVPNKFTTPILPSPEIAALLSGITIALVLAASAYVLLLSMARPRRTARDIDLELSVLSAAVFLCAPASWTHHLVMLLPAALVLLRDGVLDNHERPGSRFAAGLVLAVLALTLDDLVPREVRIASQAMMALMTAGVIGLWALCAQRLYLSAKRVGGRNENAPGSR